MSCRRVLGTQYGMLLEYDPSTLASLGLLMGRNELGSRSIAIIDSGIEKHERGTPLYVNRE